MKTLTLSLFALLSVAALAAETPAAKSPAKAARKQLTSGDIYRMTGGDLIDAREMKGRIAYVNAQTKAREALLREHAAHFSQAMRVKIDVEKGAFSFPKVQLPAETVVFIIDEPGYPSILAAPDQGWAAVNVAALATGRGEKPAYFEARVKKELTRALATASGAIDSAYPNNPVGPLASLEDLDRIVEYRLAVDVTQRMLKTLKVRGIRQYRLSTYEEACYDGWAPAPTNDVQKVIWEKAKAELNAKPANPMLITKPKK